MIVSLITRGPANPIIRAPGSPQMISPSMANDAVVPPNVGSGKQSGIGGETPASLNCVSLPEVFASCINENAFLSHHPGTAAFINDHEWNAFQYNSRIPFLSFSPITLPRLPPMNSVTIIGYNKVFFIQFAMSNCNRIMDIRFLIRLFQPFFIRFQVNKIEEIL